MNIGSKTVITITCKVMLCIIVIVILGLTIWHAGKHLFAGKDLSEIDIPCTVDTIGSWAFYDCDIKQVKIPKNIHFIGTNAFPNDCSIVRE